MHPILQDAIVQQLVDDVPAAAAELLVPILLVYLSFWALARRWMALSRVLGIASLAGFWAARTARVRCRAMEAVLRFAVAIASMKTLDVHTLSLTSSLPVYTHNPLPPPSRLALILLTELRYESFTPNPIRLAPLPSHPFPSSPQARKTFYSEPVQLVLHTTLFLLLQAVPQCDTVEALCILLAIWIIWTSLQLCMRHPTSPPLFGPIYLADSLAAFWTQTWHNAFAAPCLSLAYRPMVHLLVMGLPGPLRPSRAFARSAAVVASFGLMAGFHVYALAPVLSAEARRRVGLFFAGNGVLTVGEAAIWGRKRHWVRAVVAWGLELGLATWVAGSLGLPGGLLQADWRGLCRAPG